MMHSEGASKESDSPCHVVATFLELNHRLAVEASLPASLFSYFNKLLRILVLWTIFSDMPLPITEAADFGIAPRASSVLPPSR